MTGPDTIIIISPETTVKKEFFIGHLSLPFFPSLRLSLFVISMHFSLSYSISHSLIVFFSFLYLQISLSVSLSFTLSLYQSHSLSLSLSLFSLSLSLYRASDRSDCRGHNQWSITPPWDGQKNYHQQCKAVSRSFHFVLSHLILSLNFSSSSYETVNKPIFSLWGPLGNLFRCLFVSLFCYFCLCNIYDIPHPLFPWQSSILSLSASPSLPLSLSISLSLILSPSLSLSVSLSLLLSLSLSVDQMDHSQRLKNLSEIPILEHQTGEMLVLPCTTAIYTGMITPSRKITWTYRYLQETTSLSQSRIWLIRILSVEAHLHLLLFPPPPPLRLPFLPLPLPRHLSLLMMDSVSRTKDSTIAAIYHTQMKM